MKASMVVAVAAALMALPMSANAQARGRVPEAPEVRRGPDAAPGREMGRENDPVPYARGGEWYGHAPSNGLRAPLGTPFMEGLFGLAGTGHPLSIESVDMAGHELWTPGGYVFEVAPADWALTAPWCWSCDRFVIYPDPLRLGWYLLYDVQFGQYVHAEFMGP